MTVDSDASEYKHDFTRSSIHDHRPRCERKQARRNALEEKGKSGNIANSSCKR